MIICNGCGEEAYVKGPDAIDWCDECGVAEGNVTEIDEEENG